MKSKHIHEIVVHFLVLRVMRWYWVTTTTTRRATDPRSGMCHNSSFSLLFLSIYNLFTMIKLGVFMKNSDVFSFTTVFGDEQLYLCQNRCFWVKEQTLNFSKHLKFLKSVNYSWRYVTLCIGIGIQFLVTRMSPMYAASWSMMQHTLQRRWRWWLGSWYH